MPDSLPTGFRSRQRQIQFYVFNFLFATFIFAIDSYAVIDINFGIPYIAWVVLTFYGDVPDFTFIVAAISTLLIFLGAAFSPLGHLPLNIIVINRALTIFAVWVSAFFVRRAKRAEITVQNELWIHAGRSGLFEHMRHTGPLKTVLPEVLEFIVKYTGAQVGALYLIKDNLYSPLCFSGYSPSDSQNLPRELGSSLIGEVIKKKGAVHLTDIPKDYLSIGTGLGRAAPRELILFPMATQERVAAVIELGTFASVVPLTGQFMERISDAVASRIEVLEGHERITQLFEQSEQQNISLKRQQEDLERANENLKNQSQELEAQQEVLEQVNQQLHEEQMAQLDHQRRLEKINEELHRSQIENEEKAHALWLASKYKSEFLANMSHELRTPLNSILILAKLLDDGLATSSNLEHREYAATIQSSGTELLHLINEILDLSKVEAGRIELEIGVVSLSALAEKLERQFSANAKAKHLNLVISWDDESPRALTTDGHRLEQILRNFLANSIKFTPPNGEVMLHFGPADESRAKNFAVSIQVSDTGIGIPKDKLSVIFEPFRQVDTGTSRKYGGSGLGLAIAKELANLLGAKIEVESVENKGSTFTIHLPDLVEQLSHQPAGTTPHPLEKPSPGEIRRIIDDRKLLTPNDRTVLLINNDPTLASLISNFCHVRGLKCICAEKGELGLEDAERYQPMAILLDLNLPSINGITVLERLKQSSKTRHIPVHVFSAEDQRIRVLQMGAVGFLQKPITKEGLENAIEKIEDQLSRRSKTVLVVDDNDLERENVRRLLGNGELKVVDASSISQALDKIKNNSFDCIILNLRIGEGTGLELIRKLEHGKKLLPPIIVHTDRDLSSSENEIFQRVGRSLVVKQAKSPEHLLDEVVLFLHRVESNLPDDKREMLERVRYHEEAFEGKKLLIVDDDMRNVFALRKVLNRKGLDVVVGKNGVEGMKQLKAHPEICAVLTDIMMPEMDGLELIRRIRRDDKLTLLPIIAITAKAMKGDKETAIEAGANDYLPKPIDVEKLIALLRVWLS